MFLTPEELYELTGYRQHRKQIAKLRDLGVAFFVNACGHPKVVRAVLEGGSKTKQEPEARTWNPKWAANQL